MLTLIFTGLSPTLDASLYSFLSDFTGRENFCVRSMGES
jgi:hypothetical protein